MHIMEYIAKYTHIYSCGEGPYKKGQECGVWLMTTHNLGQVHTISPEQAVFIIAQLRAALGEIIKRTLFYMEWHYTW